MKVEIQQFSPASREDFYAVHSAAGQCFCVAWWVSTWEGWDDRTADDNRGLREQLLAENQYDGYLFYVDDAPAGWCQVGLRDRLPKLVEAHALSSDPDAFAISCLLLLPHMRGRGLAGVFLAGVIDDLRSRGVKRVEVFPRLGEGLSADEVWTGPQRLFDSLGFQLEQAGERRGVMSLRL